MRTNLLFILFGVSIFIFSCKKDPTEQQHAVNSKSVSNIATDGTLTVQVSILPPATPQTFLANTPDSTTTSTIVLQLAANANIQIDYASFKVTPNVLYLEGWNFGGGSYIQTYWGPLIGEYGKVGGSITWELPVRYRSLDSSGIAISQVQLLALAYHEDNYAFSGMLNVDSATGSPLPVCIVSNIPHLKFVSFKPDTLKNGAIEVAAIKLTGDTGWMLKQLPVVYTSTSPFGNSLDNFIVKFKGQKVANSTKANPGLLNFANGGFQHVAGQQEILRIYATNFQSYNGSHLHVSFDRSFTNPFEWVAGDGTLITPDLNKQFFKEPTQ